MTVQEYAMKENVSERTVYRWIESGKIRAKKVYNTWVIEDYVNCQDNSVNQHDDLDKYQDNRQDCLDNDGKYQDDGQIELLNKQIEQLQSEVEYLRQELSQERQRHDETQQQSNMIIMQLTKQLEQQTLLLQDMRNRSLWRRFKGALRFGNRRVSNAEYSA